MNCWEFEDEMSQYVSNQNYTEKKEVQTINGQSQIVTRKNVAISTIHKQLKSYQSQSVSDCAFDSDEDCEDFKEHPITQRRLRYQKNIDIIQREIEENNLDSKARYVMSTQQQPTLNQINQKQQEIRIGQEDLKEKTNQYILYLQNLVQNETSKPCCFEQIQNNNNINQNSMYGQLEINLFAQNIQSILPVAKDEKTLQESKLYVETFDLQEKQIQDNSLIVVNNKQIESQLLHQLDYNCNFIVIEQKVVQQQRENNDNIQIKQSQQNRRRMSCLNSPKNARTLIEITVPQ
eukprot:403359741